MLMDFALEFMIIIRLNGMNTKRKLVDNIVSKINCINLNVMTHYLFFISFYFRNSVFTLIFNWSDLIIHSVLLFFNFLYLTDVISNVIFSNYFSIKLHNILFIFFVASFSFPLLDLEECWWIYSDNHNQDRCQIFLCSTPYKNGYLHLI